MADYALAIEKLEKLTKEQRELHNKLRRSFMIEALWPGCFEYGTMRGMITGSPSKGFIYQLIRGDGETKAWPLKFVRWIETGPTTPSRPVLTSDEVPQALIDSVLDHTFREEDE